MIRFTAVLLVLQIVILSLAATAGLSIGTLVVCAVGTIITGMMYVIVVLKS